MKHVLQGACLHGGYARCEITDSDVFELYLQRGAQTVRMEVLPEKVSVRDHLVAISNNGHVLQVVEHLFSALYGMDTSAFKVVVDGPELPIFDGSSSAYAEVLEHTQHTPFKRVQTEQPVMVTGGESFIQYEPSSDESLVITTGLSHPYIGKQEITVTIDRETYRQEIAPARTFVYTDEDDPRLQDLPPYGIGITEERIHTAEPLRFVDEPVRHKTLDLLGDLFILQKRLCGTIRAYNTYHELNQQFVSEVYLLLTDPG